MALDNDFAVFGVGFAGGVANEILHWWGLRENPKLPRYATRPLYWAITLAMMFLGGGLAWLAGIGRTPSDHLVGIDAMHRPVGQPSSFAGRRAEEGLPTS